MNNIVLDFRHNYVRGERLESQEIVYQYDSGRVVEAYVPETEEGFVLNIGFENTSVLSVISVDDVVVDEEGGYKILATIPDSILAGYGNLLVYVVAGGGANVLATTYEGIVPVRYKPVAEGYIPPDDPATSIIERCEVAAAAAVEAADDARDIADSVQGATAIATAAAETATSAAETATSAATRAETAATAAEAAMTDKLDDTFITGLDESASGDDTDLLAVGYRGTSTLRKFSLANLATYIRDKLTSLTFSVLNTSNKTLPGAINELDTSTARGRSLLSGNIDSILKSGFYWVQKANTAGTQPGYDYYMLIVCNTKYNDITLQIAYNMKSSAHKVRMYALGSWNEWA